MKPYSIDLRQKIVDAYSNQEGSYRQLAQHFRVSFSFVKRLMKRYKDTGKIEPKPHGGGQQSKLKAEHLETLRQVVEEDNDAILEELCELFYQKTQLRVSRATMGRSVEKLNLTRKKKTFYATERDTPRVRKLRQEIRQLLQQINLENLVFVDETGVNLAMTRLYARALKGKRAVGARPDGRGKNLTLVGAMALRGLVAAMTFFGGCDRNAFQTFVDKVLIPNLWPGAVVVMDNFSSHQVAGIRKAIEAVGANLIYLSPYSPDFSPIELCWSKIKEFLRSQAARHYQALDEAITAAINAIAPQDILSWFRHCGYCVPSN